MRAARTAALLVFALAAPAAAQAVDESALLELSADVRAAGIPEPVTFAKRIAAGRSRMRKAQYLEAAEEFYAAAEMSPAHPLPNVFFTHAMLGHRSWREAKDVLRKALDMYPRWRRLRYPVGQDFARGDFEAMVRELEEARAGEPADGPARREYAFLLGYCYLGSGDVERATIAFSEAAAGEGGIAEARAYHAGLTAPVPSEPGAQRPRAEGPAPALSEPGAQRPRVDGPATDADPLRRGAAMAAAGRYDDAADAFLSAVVDDPSGTDGILAHFELSHALFALSRWSQAVTALRRGLRRYPEWCRVALNRRDWYPADRPGDFEAHWRALEAAAQAAPGDARLQFLLGYTAFFIGRRAQAKAAFEAAQAAGPDADAARFLAVIAEGEALIPGGAAPGDPGAAPATLAPAAPAPGPAPAAPPLPDDAARGAERFAAKDYDAAAALYAKAAAARPKDGAVQVAASRALFAAGDWAGAVTALRRGLQAHPTAEWPKLAGGWRVPFPDPGHYDARGAALQGEVEQLAHSTDLDRRFLLAFANLAAARIDQALAQFRVLKHMDPERTDAEARFFIERLKVE